MTEDNNEPIEISIEEQLRNSEDKYLRIYAEFENYKKRVQKEKDDLVSNTKTQTLNIIHKKLRSKRRMPPEKKTD